MNSSLWSADRTTHIKIVAVSLMAAIVVVTIGISARNSDTDSTTVLISTDASVVVKAGKPANYSTVGASTIR